MPGGKRKVDWAPRRAQLRRRARPEDLRWCPTHRTSSLMLHYSCNGCRGNLHVHIEQAKEVSKGVVVLVTCPHCQLLQRLVGHPDGRTFSLYRVDGKGVVIPLKLL